VKRLIHTFVPHQENDFRPYLLRTAGIAIVSLVIVGAAIGTTAYRVTLSQSDFLASVLPGVLVNLANTDRGELALASLTTNPRLTEAARLKAEDMAVKGYFAHQSPDGKTPWYWFNQAGYSFVYAGENLAINFDDSSAVNDAWMNSPGHRSNLLNGHYTEIGIATAKGQYQGRETTFVVQLFGSPARTSAVATKAPVTVATSTIKSASTTEDFVAVKSAEASPITEMAETAAVSASFLDRLLTSPTTLLRLLYVLIGLVLGVALVMVFWHSHEHLPLHSSLGKSLHYDVASYRLRPRNTLTKPTIAARIETLIFRNI
jgi:hypothetical protein